MCAVTTWHLLTDTRASFVVSRLALAVWCIICLACGQLMLYAFRSNAS